MAKSEIDVQYQRQLLAAEKVLDSILSSTGPADLCRQVVHSNTFPSQPEAVNCFTLTVNPF
jgi:hypothetical protein